MLLDISFEQIENTLKGWGYNSGEFEELVVWLAIYDGFYNIQVELNNKTLTYWYTLNRKGRRIANVWAKLHKKTPIPSQGHFWDESIESSLRTLEEWGIVPTYY